MADSKLSALPTGSAILDADLFYSDQSGNSVKQPATALATYAQSKNPASITYYISAAGSDSNNGTSAQTPWQTIAKVNSITPSPNTSFLFRGTDIFSGTITVKAGGQPGAPITYSSYGNGQATISPGNGDGFDCTDFGNITVTNLIFTGSGITTNTGHGFNFQSTNTSCQNFLLSGLTVSNFGNAGILFRVGNFTANSPIWNGITITNCVVHDCGMSGIQGVTQSTSVAVFPFFQGFSNVLIDHCTIFNITGQNSIFAAPFFGGTAAVFQGTTNFTVQYCNIFNNATLSNNVNGGSGNGDSGPAIYSASNTNTVIQFNEVWGQSNIGGGHDGHGIQLDFGINGALVQYNYVHDNASSGFATGTLTLASGPQQNLNTVCRYNVFANNGAMMPNTSLPPGIIVYTLAAGEMVSGLAVYNNTIVGKNSPVGYALFDSTNIGHAGTMYGVIANNIINGDGNTVLLNYSDNGLRFIGNDYVGGSSVKKVIFASAPFTTIAGWLAASGNSVQESVDGASVAITAGLDPLLSGTYSIASPISGGYVPGRVSNFELASYSPVAGNGIDLTSTLPFQAAVPPVLPTPGSYNGVIDFDFKGGFYFGDVIGSISCSRTATTATDLLASSPLGASFNTFAANTLRITSGKGLLVEEARTQFLANPGAPATQTTASLSSGTTYILWVNGTGSATVSSGTGTVNGTIGNDLTAVQGKPIGFSMGSTGTAVVTVTGTLNQFQMENDNNGTLVPTSFISAIGTRDADVVTTTTATNIGSFLNDFLAAGSGPFNSGFVQCFFNIPTTTNMSGTEFLNNAILIEDSNSTSYMGLQNYGSSGFFGAVTRGILNFGGVQLHTSNNVVFNTRQSIAGRTDKSSGQALVMNGGAIATGATSSPSPGTTTNIGNRSAKDQALNGYIERILVDMGTPNPVLSPAQLQVTTSTTPIATNVTQDFFGNLVPNSSGFYSIGAHQQQSLPSGFTVAKLPPAASSKGVKLYVTDANATFTAGIGAVVAGGGANIVPVFSDGTNWRIG